MKLGYNLLFAGTLATGLFLGTTKSQAENKSEKKSTELKPISKTVAKTLKANVNVSLVLEAKTSITKGVDYLLSEQGKDGAWMFHPAITSLCTLAIANSPDADEKKPKEAIEKARKFILKNAQKDGSIWNKSSREYPNYSTSVSLIALAYLNRPEDEKIIRAARKFLIDSQFDEISPDNASFGGIGYGKNLRPDLSNTQLALEALYLTDYLDREQNAKSPEDAKKADKMWANATKFLTRCQNLKETNDQGWVASDPDNKGGFIYLPEKEESKAGQDVTDGKKTLRSYGSMTYAGLKSMLYCKMDKNDVRVKAAFDWAQRNYTLDKNPGMGLQGHFYYLHTFAKTMTAMGQDTIKDANGKEHNWREDIIKKFLSTQKAKGHWVNSEGRWWENQPSLVTAYSLLSLEQAVGNDIATLIKKMK